MHTYIDSKQYKITSTSNMAAMMVGSGLPTRRQSQQCCDCVVAVDQWGSTATEIFGPWESLSDMAVGGTIFARWRRRQWPD